MMVHGASVVRFPDTTIGELYSKPARSYEDAWIFASERVINTLYGPISVTSNTVWKMDSAFYLHHMFPTEDAADVVVTPIVLCERLRHQFLRDVYVPVQINYS